MFTPSGAVAMARMWQLAEAWSKGEHKLCRKWQTAIELFKSHLFPSLLCPTPYLLPWPGIEFSLLKKSVTMKIIHKHIKGLGY